MTTVENQTDRLEKEIIKLKKEIKSLKKTKKFGLVWEEREREKNIDDGEYYPYLVEKGQGFGIENGDSNKNILIEGDNYHALEILNYTHKEKIDVIYIDPPYNTGKPKEFRYGDRWIDENDGYRHSYWLSFMNKRLQLAKTLMSKEGVIFISINDHEQARLKLLCDDIFGKSNFISCLIWNQKTGTQAGHFTGSHEYVLVYARNKSLLPYFKDDSGDNIKHGALKKISKKNPASNFTFPKGFKFHAKEDKELDDSWGNSEKTTLVSGRMIAKDGELLEDVTLYAGWAMKSQMTQWIYHDKSNTYDTKGQKVVNFYFNSNGVLWYEKERKTQHPKTVLDEGGTIVGTGELGDIFPNVDDLPFKFPKPLSLVQKLIGYVINKKESPLILDFFAGSGTTGQAIMDLAYKEMEKTDTHNLLPKYILVTNNENNICEEVTYQRLRRSNNKYNYNSNLEYLKIQTLAHDDKKHSELDIKEFMVDKCTEIIKVKERCFDLEPISDFLLRFNKKGQEVYVLQNIYDMTPKDYEEAREAINSSTSPIVTIYILALQNQNHYKRKFKDVNKPIVFEPLPENFLKILRKIQRKKR